MFSHCTTLGQLNAERTRLSMMMPLIEVNNAYNARRLEILRARKNFLELTPVFVTVEEPVRYAGIPIAGRAQVPNTIILTQKGFLY